MGFFSKTSLASDSEVVQLLRSMHTKHAHFEAEVEKLKAGHASLRGFVYARVRKAGAAVEEPEEELEPQPASAPSPRGGALNRDDLRRMMTTSGRFVPGKPPRHE